MKNKEWISSALLVVGIICGLLGLVMKSEENPPELSPRSKDEEENDEPETVSLDQLADWHTQATY